MKSKKPEDGGGQPENGKSARRHRRLRRMLWRLALAAAALYAAATAYRTLSHFPPPLERRLSEALSSDGTQVVVSGGSLALFPLRARVGSVTVRARQSGSTNAAVHATGAELRLRAPFSAPSLDWIRNVSAASLELDVEALGELSGDESGESAAIPDFGPIRISIRRITANGFALHDVTGMLSSENGIFHLADAAISFHGPGERNQTLRGQIAVSSDAPAVETFFSGALDFSKTALLLRALDCGEIAEELERFEFRSAPPEIEAQLCWAPEQKKRALGILLHSGPMYYNGVRIATLSAAIQAGGAESWERVEADPVEITRSEGALSGCVEYHLDKDSLSLNVTSTLNPFHFATMARLVDPDSLPETEFARPTEIRCAGTIELGESKGEGSALRFTATSPGATVRGFAFTTIEAEGSLKGHVFDLPKFTANAMGGELEGSLAIDIGEEEPLATAALEARNVPESHWAYMIGSEEDARAGGFLDVKASFEGPLSELGDSVPTRGRGSFSSDIRDANLFRIPLFAGLTDVLARFIPGVDLLVEQNSARIRATLEDGKWNLSELALSGAAFSIDGSGTALADGSEIDIVARVRILNGKTWLGRVIRSLLSPVSALFGIRASGSLDAPRWTLAPFSRSSAK